MQISSAIAFYLNPKDMKKIIAWIVVIAFCMIVFYGLTNAIMHTYKLSVLWSIGSVLLTIASFIALVWGATTIMKDMID